ncbi:O-methyltransferase, putative [Talaromyces stipitatus ATCC 10500]|uniref:O-methyltransferase, putative n=1 Tax=Talaromyces stipitatus (strain ATCC 10500 / CBS 375.48 / QM 6759 / NRRL 1006) TaxID=441959 RepID=B8MM92_TALSN|nr:O-methyltransferase, putative [Talaromyces stipitatus ATCC 10500]EED13646.1 O-methyltransferase, putative [Talaromyces stipitatus ATCC 10500]
MTIIKRQSLVLEKAREALKQAERLVNYLEENGHEEPNFSSTSPPHPENNEYDSIRIDLSQTAQDLMLLANGPLQWIRTFCCCHHDLAAWQVALRFKFFTIVPLDRPISVKEMATHAKMDEDRLRRVIKFLTTQRCFQELDDDKFEHTSLSAYIARNKDIEQCFAFEADEMFEASSLTATSIEKLPYNSVAEYSAFNLRFGTSPYKWYAENPERGARFASAMAGLVQSIDTTELRDRFPWGKLGNKKVVDVGGGSGHISIYLANEFPELSFVVQDVNTVMLEEGPKRADFPRVKDRVLFMQYSFYDPQPITDAGLFFLRQVIHNYPDDVCVKIFKSFIPALEKCDRGTSLLINDMVLPPPNTEPKVEEHHLRQIDIHMLNGYAAKQRTLREFQHLLKQADPRLEVIKVHGKGIMGLLEVKFQQ